MGSAPMASVTSPDATTCRVHDNIRQVPSSAATFAIGLPKRRWTGRQYQMKDVWDRRFKTTAIDDVSTAADSERENRPRNRRNSGSASCPWPGVEARL
ncbi:hypothetical protein RHECNPAF_280038 [Rhizobium etli CNPAF512]|nr:hypothetical protein RHECNPAF_280038 [Rhizobium etli CNPAF512]